MHLGRTNGVLKFPNLQLGFGLSLLLSCQTVSPRENTKVHLKHDGVITIGDDKPLAVRRGDRVETNGKPVLVEAPGHISTLLVPKDRGNDDIEITLQPIEQWGGELFETRANRVLNDLVEHIVEVQGLIATKHPDEALEKLKAAEQRFPRVSYLKFLRVSCLIALGNMTSARETLEASLREFPDDRAGQELYRTLFSDGSGKDKTP